ncbi:4-hydroxyphenylacetate 3-monooxygenase [Bartonella clarridgeiae 73]|uniref:4-hydroxyphenylacetate 3-monooxygenase n=1 Tax=Bartonella clarridgeiae (strain CCUG 45776 / CIP 104772 / 73) TaxID=696125 RepID=E6YHP1_BARC7|nr:flavin reductase [Bartonella clarridgeiae]WCR55046.1 MAG: 4-hydroxyphenylacetate 3-monooxygenase reductase component [Bartonella clarridgeiae]CBI76379.1 4-hydroxyphenylacetate 3-monooxygenase [Bartonella clarridgeiae 73]
MSKHKTHLISKPQSIAPVSSQEYRDTMSHFAGAVHIVTTDGIKGRRGVTISACCSLSDDPPTLLVCLMRYNSENKIFMENGNFCVNSLTGKHRLLADVFSGRCGFTQMERFATAQWSVLQTGAPSLSGALASLDCNLICWQEYATHYILIGEVVAINRNQEKDALLYFNRDYHTLALSL